MTDLHDPHAEQATLGAAMTAPAVVEHARAHITGPGDFFLPAHGIVWAAIVELADAGAPVDPVAVADLLRKHGDLRRVGGAPYLHELMAAPPTIADIGTYARIVAELAAKRRFRQGITRVGQMLEDPTVDLDEAFAFLDQLRGATGPERGAGASWSPLDLGPYLRGEVTRPQPAVGIARSDGLRLLYPGKEHSVIGEMESGKSWFAVACAAAELTGGRHVVYIHFEENDPTDTLERLQALGVPDEAILARFHFVGPEEPVTPARLAALLEVAPSLVVLDGVNEAMALHGWGIREEDGAAAFRRHLVKPATAAGAAVLSADHVTKDRETRGRYALGSIHKGNGLSGSLILLEAADPFGRGARGRSHVFVTKDRPGHLRRYGRPGKTPGKTFLGELVVDDTRLFSGDLELRFWEPNDDGTDMPDADTDADVDALVLAAVDELTAGGKQATGRAVRVKTKLRNAAVLDALERLVLDGKVIRTKRGAAHVHTPANGSQPLPEDQSPDGPAVPSDSGSPYKGGTGNHSREPLAERFRESSGTTRNHSADEGERS